ncbi:hypothetical protein HK100_011300 [Physocladia obscura]|uniref:Uncharacterized protein n=1 Tax=Physocladia obscura TaxID=109957 RepID=A0AAD5T1K8_9FUNG|nr:hypothetical protein HK100_011300 [Physocladia obscura]
MKVDWQKQFLIVLLLCAALLLVQFRVFLNSVPAQLGAAGTSADPLINLSVNAAKFNAAAEFEFFPPIAERPLKANAVITLVTHSSNDSTALDPYWQASLLHAFIFLHRNETKFNQSDDIEYAVMIVPRIPAHFRTSLLQLGVRLIQVPPISFADFPGLPNYTVHQPDMYVGMGSKHEYMYTKLQMWRLESFYKAILYHDSDLFYFNENPAAHMFDVLRSQSAPFVNATLYNASRQNSSTLIYPKKDEARRPYFFAGVWDCNGHIYRSVNGGLFLFTPVARHVEKMMAIAAKPPFNEFVEQSLVSFYHDSIHELRLLDMKYNIMHGLLTLNFPQESIVGFHAKAWKEAPSFYTWRKRVLEMRNFLQIEMPEYQFIPPYVDENLDNWRARMKY